MLYQNNSDDAFMAVIKNILFVSVLLIFFKIYYRKSKTKIIFKVVVLMSFTNRNITLQRVVSLFGMRIANDCRVVIHKKTIAGATAGLYSSANFDSPQHRCSGQRWHPLKTLRE